MSKSQRKVFYVHVDPPFSPWANSGASRAICHELRRRKLLWGGLSSDVVSNVFRYTPGTLCEMVLNVAGKLPCRLTKRPYWRTEKEGSLGRELKKLPPGSSVIYVFNMPEIDSSLDIKRYLFLNLSLYDAVRENVWGHGQLTESEISIRDKEQRRMLTSVDGLITPSTYAAHSIHRDFGVPMSRITPFGYGSTLGATSESSITASKFEKPRILYSGRDWERKNGPLLFEAFLSVRNVIPEAELWIVGPDRNPVNHPGAKFFGFIDKTTKSGLNALGKIYREASVFCMPTGCEPWGLVLTEAAAFGLPIVGPRTWSLPDIVEDGVTGQLVDELTSEALASALIDVHDDPQKLVEMAKSARKRYSAVLDWNHCVARILSRVMPEAVSDEKIILMQ